jgi:vancomycin resistance protein YoaR
MPKRPALGLLFAFFTTVGLLTLAAVSVLAWYQWRYNDKIYPGVSAAGVPLGGLTVEQAASALTDALTPYGGAEITLRFGNKAWALSPDALGVTVDGGATAAQAYAVGRHGLSASASSSPVDMLDGLRQDALDQWRALREGVDLQPILQYDGEQQAAVIRRIQEEVDLAPVEGALTITETDVTGTPGRLGRAMDTETTRRELAKLVQVGKGGVIDVLWQERRPSVMSVEPALVKAKAMLGRSVVLNAETLDGPKQYAADAASVRKWLTLTPILSADDGQVDLEVKLDREQVQAWVAGIAKELDRPSKNASLDFDPKAMKVIVLDPSAVGQKVDVEAGVAAVEAALAAPGPVDANGAPQPQPLALAVNRVEPKIDSNRVDEMGIVELVSEGTSTYKGSAPERVHNILNAAGKFQHVVVPPGEEFSFNRNVGSVSADNGFVDGLIIAGDRTAVGIGGGVCQVSTTAFRAAFYGGFPIVERWAHGYVVGWYGKPGMDASIFTPNVDFRFRNDTPHFLLVKAFPDEKKGTLTFRIYGTKPDRTVEMTGPVISNVQPALPPSYQLDASMPAGKIKQVDWAKEGMDAVVTRIIRYGDGQVKEEKFVSKYRPWQAVYLYGPGAKVPGAQSSATTP